MTGKTPTIWGISHNTSAVATLASLATLAALADSNIDNTVPNKYAWGENVGWTNWRDANATAQGVFVGPFVMAGFIWGENIGWINVGDGSPGSTCGGNPCYGNTTGADFGVNIDPDGDLHGYAWGENVGWINFDGGAMASPPQPARIECDGRLTGYAWGENVGWINLDVLDAGKFVAVDAATVPLDCDLNDDRLVDGEDIQIFVSLLISGGGNWKQICSGDLEIPPDGIIDVDDIMPFVSCLLS